MNKKYQSDNGGRLVVGTIICTHKQIWPVFIVNHNHIWQHLSRRTMRKNCEKIITPFDIVLTNNLAYSLPATQW